MRALIVGAGAAGTALAQTLSRHGQQATLIDSRLHPIELPPLSKSLFTPPFAATDSSVQDPEAAAADGLTRAYHRLDLTGVELVGGTAAIIGPGTVTLANGTVYNGDVVVISTGLTPRPAPFSAQPPAHIFTISNEDSALRARQAITRLQETTPPGTVGIVGSGFLAVEMARSAADAGFHPTVYLRGPRPMPTLSPLLSDALVALHTAAGVTFAPNTPDPDPTAHALWLAAVGATPHLPTLPAEVVLNTRGRIAVDEQLRAAPGIFALGDIAEPAAGPMHNHPALGTESAATSQGTWLGTYLATHDGSAALGTSAAKNPSLAAPTAHLPAAPDTWRDLPWNWSLQGPLRVFVVGARLGDVDPEPVVIGDLSTGKAQLLFFRSDGEHRLARVETVGNPGGHNAARKVLAKPATAPTRGDANGLDLRAWARQHA